MPKGMTPKNRMLKTTASLARALKPSGRLNVDDMKRASDARKKMPLSEIKKRKLIAKISKQEPKKLNKPTISSETMKKMAGMLGLSVGDMMSKKVFEKGPRKMQNPRTEGTRMDKGPRKMQSPRGEGTRMEKGPKKMTPLGPLRPIKERSQSKLVSRRRGMGKR